MPGGIEGCAEAAIGMGYQHDVPVIAQFFEGRLEAFDILQNAMFLQNMIAAIQVAPAAAGAGIGDQRGMRDGCYGLQNGVEYGFIGAGAAFEDSIKTDRL